MFTVSVLLLIAAILFFSIAVSRGAKSLEVAFIFVAFIAFTLIPTSGAIEWFLPSGKRRGYGRKRSLTTVAVLVVAFGYWALAIIADLMSPSGSISLIGPGAVLSSLGLFMYFYVDITRTNKELK